MEQNSPTGQMLHLQVDSFSPVWVCPSSTEAVPLQGLCLVTGLPLHSFWISEDSNWKV